MIHDGDAVAEALRFFHVMRREQHRAAGGTELPDDLPELAPRLWIETGRRLIEEQQVRLADERTGNRQPLLLSARQCDDARPPFFFELDERQHLVDRVRVTVERAEHGECLLDGELVGELRFLELNAQALAERASCGAFTPGRAKNLDVAAVLECQSLEDFDGRGLACPVRAQQAEALAARDGEVDAGNRDDVAEALEQRATADG